MNFNGRRRGGRVASISHLFQPELNRNPVQPPRHDPDAEKLFASGPDAPWR